MTANNTATAAATATEKAKVESPFLRGAQEVADYLRLNECTVRRMWKRHRLPYTKIGGLRIVRKADLDEVIERATFPAYGANKAAKGKGGAK